MGTRHMLLQIIAAAFRLITVHGPGGEEITLNIDEISSIRQVLTGNEDDSAFHRNVKCVVVMSNGRFIGAKESCLDIVHLIAITDRKAREEDNAK